MVAVLVADVETHKRLPSFPMEQVQVLDTALVALAQLTELGQYILDMRKRREMVAVLV